MENNYEKFKNNLILSYELTKYSKQLVLVEGGLDLRFFDHLNCGNVVFQSVDDILRSEFMLKENQDIETSEDEHKNNKVNIKKLFDEAYLNINLQQMVKELGMIGIVDKDFDDEYPYGRYLKLISNDTHDLETMLLRGDSDLVDKLIQLSVDMDVITKSKYMAYQLAQVYVVLKKYFTSKNDQVKYHHAKHRQVFRYFDGVNLNIKNYVNYITFCYKQNKKDNTKSIMDSPQKLYKELVLAMQKENYLNKNGEFRLTYNNFENTEPKDFWQMVNGHDLLQIILYFNINNSNFESRLFKKRNFEAFVIDNYNYDKFIKESLYLRMKNFKLLN